MEEVLDGSSADSNISPSPFGTAVMTVCEFNIYRVHEDYGWFVYVLGGLFLTKIQSDRIVPHLLLDLSGVLRIIRNSPYITH